MVCFMALNLPSNQVPIRSHQAAKKQLAVAHRGAEAMGRPGVRRCTCRLPGAGQGGAREKKQRGPGMDLGWLSGILVNIIG